MTNLRTRSKTNLWLISPTSEKILKAGLPTNEAVLKYFFFLHKDKGFTIKDSAKHTVQEILSFWVGKNSNTTKRFLPRQLNNIFQLLSKVTKESLQNANELSEKGRAFC